MDGTIQDYTLDMAADTKRDALEVKQCDTNSRRARIKLVAFKEPWIIPFGCQIHINVRKTDGTIANATCTQEDESTVMAPITEQMTTVIGTQLGELYFLGNDGDIKSQTFPVIVREMIMDQSKMESSDDFASLKDALRQVETSTDMADAATQYATAQGDRAGDAAQRAEDAADSIQAAVDAAAAAKVSETNAKASETAAAQTQQEVTDYVEAQKAAFVGYDKRESDSRYANALTATTTGEGGVTLEDAWTAPVLGLDVVGKSEQVVTTGANLWPFGDATFMTMKVFDIALQPGTYTIMADVTSSDTDSTKCLIYNSTDGETLGYIDRGLNQSLTFMLNKNIEGINLYAGTNYSGSQGDTCVFKNIMLNAGDTVLPWEAYSDGVPSPSPEYPQDIISVGTMSTGAQLLNADTIVQGMVNAETGALSVTPSFVSSDFIPVKPGDYLLSGEGIKPYLNYVIFFDNEKVIKGNSTIKSSNGKFTVTEGIAYARLRFVSKTGAEGTVTPSEVAAVKPMLNAGDTALPWEPYTGGDPGPSVEYPQALEVGVTGAQLLDSSKIPSKTVGGSTVTNNEDGSFTISGSGTSKLTLDTRFVLSHYKLMELIGDKREFTLSSNIITYPYLFFNLYDANGSVMALQLYNTTKVTKTIPDSADMDTLFAQFGYYGSSEQEILSGKQIPMLNAGTTALPWEPYRSVSAPITLTEPLRGIGEYRDRIMCKDGAWGIERQVAEIVFDGSEDESHLLDPTTTYHRFKIKVNNPLPLERHKALSNRFMYSGNSNAPGNVFAYYDTIFLYTSHPDVETFRLWLGENPTTVMYPLSTPTWEPLPSVTQQDLNELTTYAGTTHLTITAGGPPAEVTLEYVQDTQKAIEQHDAANRQYTDNQIAAIVAALPTATQAAIVDNQTSALLAESEV